MNARSVFTLVLTVLLNPASSHSQELSKKQIVDLNGIPAENDLGDLYRRLSKSDFVVVGTAVDETAVNRRVQTKTPSLDADIGGVLYTISVERTVCRSIDVDPNATADPGKVSTIYIFVPRDETPYTGGRRLESLTKRGRYLLFLIKSQEQKQWIDSYQLNAQHTYYRAEERSRGVVQLEKHGRNDKTVTKQPSILAKVTQLCEALRPPKVDEKLAALNKLAASRDPILRREAREAIKDIGTARK
jgi:hypothetical protein